MGIIISPAPLFPGAASFPGNSLATDAVALPVARKQLAVPQLYPVGQHPAVGPALVGQMDHPLAHVEACSPASEEDAAAAVAAVRGTTMVAPLETMVVEAVLGHEVVWQLRPVWQQPPP